MGGVRTFGSATATGRFTRSIGRYGAKCSYGSGANIDVLGERLVRGGTTMSFMNAADCIGWWGRGVIWKGWGGRPREKMIGEPDAGNPHVRFDEGRQETCVRAARLSPTPPESPSSAMLLSLHWSARSSPLRSCQVDRRRRPVIETLVQALVVVELEVAGDAGSRLRHRRVIL